jgi:hypothetical protein
MSVKKRGKVTLVFVRLESVGAFGAESKITGTKRAPHDLSEKCNVG